MMVYFHPVTEQIVLVMPVTFMHQGRLNQGYDYELEESVGFTDIDWEKAGWVYVGDAD